MENPRQISGMSLAIRIPDADNTTIQISATKEKEGLLSYHTVFIGQ
jgi:hypothetical protein